MHLVYTRHARQRMSQRREVRVVFEEIEAGVLLIYTVMRPRVKPLE